MGRDDEGRAEARRARVVTYGLIGLLLVVAAGQLEPWPFSSFRLFSERRTGERVAYVLVALDDGGRAHPVRLGPAPESVRAGQRQLPGLAELPSARRRSKVRALLDLAAPDPTGFDPRTARSVVVQRVTRRLDPGGGPATELDRTDIARVALR
ncbi:hypothetical protein BH10ACT1_BH10ACT1_31100 [soil metagenome]